MIGYSQDGPVLVIGSPAAPVAEGIEQRLEVRGTDARATHLRPPPPAVHARPAPRSLFRRRVEPSQSASERWPPHVRQQHDVAQLSRRRRRPGLVGLRSPAHPVTVVATVPVIPTASTTNARVSPRRIDTNPETDSIANRARPRLGSSAAAHPPSSPQTDDPAAPDCGPSCHPTRALTREIPSPSFPSTPGSRFPLRCPSASWIVHAEETAVVQPGERPATKDLIGHAAVLGVTPESVPQSARQAGPA
jgi:hypothetical protein